MPTQSAIQSSTQSSISNHHSSIPPDPYRLFFPLGIALGVAGVGIWPLYAFGAVATYSGRAHALVQADGFLYAFVAGFLLTAVPRFTGTKVPSLVAQSCLAGLLVISAAAAELQAFATSTAAFTAAHLVLLGLVGRRFLSRRQDPPPTFVLIGLGLIAGLAGAAINTGVASEVIAPFWDLLGKRLLTEGMVLLLVLGVGGFLGPRLLGFAALPNFSAPASFSTDTRVPLAAGLVIFFSLIAEYGFEISWMAVLRSAVVSGVIIGSLRLWQRPAVRTTLSWSVWTSHWLIVTGVWLSALAPRYRIDFLHVLFIGGFSLLILAVSTRVTLSHGGHDLGAERRSWPLRAGLTLTLLAMLARIGAPFAANSYFDHLGWAALSWIAGMLVWGSYLVRKIGG